MDLQMPEMDGFAAVRAIRRLESAPAHVVILALTADLMPETKALCNSAVLDGFIAKPASWNAIHQEYDRSLSQVAVSARSGGVPHLLSSGERSSDE